MKKSKHILAVIIGILFVGAIAVVVKSRGKEEYEIISTIKSSFDTKPCPACGASVKANDKFCPKCGRKMEG